METPHPTGVGAYMTSLSTSRCTRRKRTGAAICIQAVYRGERTRNRVVQPALAAFRDVCDRISAECPGLTAEGLCGPVHLPRWLTTNYLATAPGASYSGAGSVSGGSADCSRGGASTGDGPAAAAATTTLLGATAPRVEEAVEGPDESEELKRPPPRPATPRGSPTVASGCVLAPSVVASAEGRNTTEAVGQERESREEEEEAEKEQEEQEVVNSNALQTENMGEVSDSIDASCTGGSAPKLVEDSVEQHAIDGSDESSVPSANEAQQGPFRHRRHRSTGSSDGEEKAQPKHSFPSCSDGEAERPTICDKLPVGSNVVDVAGSTLLATRSTADADVDCLTYSDAEDDGLAAAPAGKDATDNSVLLPPRPNDSSPSPLAPPHPRPISLVGNVVASSSPGDRAQGSGGRSFPGPGDGSDASLHGSKKLLHSPVGKITVSASNGWKESDGGVEGSGGGEMDGAADDKRENSEPPAVEDGSERRSTVVDSREEGETVRKFESAASPQDAAESAAPAAGEARNGREGERTFAGGKTGRSSADILARAYAACQSPTRDTPSLLGRGQIRGENLGRSLTGSVCSSFDISPLKGESISTSVLATARDGCGTGYSDGVGDGSSADLLAAAKAVVGDEGSFADADAAAVGEGLSQPFSEWSDEEWRPAQSKAALGFSADVGRSAGGGFNAHSNSSSSSSRRPEPTLEIAAQGDDARQRRRFSEEEGCDGERAASIADWSLQELEEELCRVREAIENRVRYLLSIGRESGSAAV